MDNVVDNLVDNSSGNIKIDVIDVINAIRKVAFFWSVNAKIVIVQNIFYQNFIIV